MTELQNIEADIKTIAEKIEAWFEKHFSHLAPGTPEHSAAIKAKDDLKVTLTTPITPAAPTPAPETAN